MLPEGRVEDSWFPNNQDWQIFNEDYEPADSDRKAAPKVGPQTLQRCAELSERSLGSPLSSVCTFTFFTLCRSQKRGGQDGH